MAQIQDSTKKQHPRNTNCFLGCFGFSGSPYKVKENTTKKINTTGRLKLSISWFSSSKKSPKKTVAVVNSATEKLHQRKESFPMVKLSKKFSTNEPQKVPAGRSVPRTQIPAPTGDAAVAVKENKRRGEKSKKKINLENGKSLNHSDSTTKETSTGKKGLCRRNSWSQPTSRGDKNEDSRQATAVLSHSTSMPPASNGKQTVGNGGADGCSEAHDMKNETWAGKFDQLVGMSIIVVTILIMIIWGKLCAILCTSAWLYFYPILLRPWKNDEPKPMVRNGTKSLDLDVDSQKHKKKVVFEGFLERNHRLVNGVGIL